MGDEHLDTIPATGSDDVIKSSVEDLVPIPSESEGIPEHMCDVHFHDNSLPLDVSKDQIKDFSESNNEVSSIDDDSFSINNIDFVEPSPLDSELVSSEVMEIVIPEVGGIDDDILLTIKDDILPLKDNPTPSSKFLTKSSSISPKSFLEETNTFHNSLPEFENFYFDLEEISSGSTTTHSDISLPNYEAFYFDNDHIKEISSGSTTTHSDVSLSEYDSFIFDLTNEEFADELAHIIYPPEYDCFYFWNLPDPGELMSILNSEIRENLSTTRVNSPIEDDHSPLLAYVVWIFLAYLTYPVIPPYLHPFRNEDTIFDPGITINRFCSFKPDLSHCDIPILEELLDNYSLSLPANESYHFDIPSPYRPPAKPPDGKTGTLNIKMIGDVSDQKVPIPGLTITRILNQEKLPDLLSHMGFEAFQPSAECAMIINGKNIPLLNIPLFHFYPP
nr:hypothetical protein [Tanacetum cinerariifolium]